MLEFQLHRWRTHGREKTRETTMRSGIDGQQLDSQRFLTQDGRRLRLRSGGIGWLTAETPIAPKGRRIGVIGCTANAGCARPDPVTADCIAACPGFYYLSRTTFARQAVAGFKLVAAVSDQLIASSSKRDSSAVAQPFPSANLSAPGDDSIVKLLQKMKRIICF
jgi:hypothetical protein